MRSTAPGSPRGRSANCRASVAGTVRPSRPSLPGRSRHRAAAAAHREESARRCCRGSAGFPPPKQRASARVVTGRWPSRPALQPPAIAPPSSAANNTKRNPAIAVVPRASSASASVYAHGPTASSMTTKATPITSVAAYGVHACATRRCQRLARGAATGRVRCRTRRHTAIATTSSVSQSGAASSTGSPLRRIAGPCGSPDVIPVQPR